MREMFKPTQSEDRQRLASVQIQRQGLTVVEWDADEELFIVCTPDGVVQFAPSVKKAKNMAQKWAKKNVVGIGIMTIEWRKLRKEDWKTLEAEVKK